MQSPLRRRRGIVSTFKHVLLPPRKIGAKSRSWSYLSLSLADKQNSVLLASFPKSGWNWTNDILTYCVIKHFTGSFEIGYAEEGTLKQRERRPASLFTPADARSSDRKSVRARIPALDIDYCLHTHNAWTDVPLCGLDKGKVIILLRDIPTNLYSFYRSRVSRYEDFEELLRTGVIDRIVNFYNLWGAFCDLPHARYRVFKYEHLRRAPVEKFREMIEFAFDVEIGEKLIADAVSYYSFDKQKQREWKFSEDETRHFHFHGATDYSDMIAPDTMAMIRGRIAAGLRYDFGYGWISKA